MKLVMVQGGGLGFGAGAAVSGGSFVVSSLPKATSKVDGKGVYAGPLSWTFSGGSASGCDPGTVAGAGTISPGSVNNKTDGSAWVLEGDSVTINFAGTSGGNPVSVPGQTVKVADAGQSSVKAD